jgi:hypothetical protein
MYVSQSHASSTMLMKKPSKLPYIITGILIFSALVGFLVYIYISYTRKTTWFAPYNPTLGAELIYFNGSLTPAVVASLKVVPGNTSFATAATAAKAELGDPVILNTINPDGTHTITKTFPGLMSTEYPNTIVGAAKVTYSCAADSAVSTYIQGTTTGPPPDPATDPGCTVVSIV